MHIAAPYSNPERVVAIKAIGIEKLEGKLALVHHEVKSLRKVDHPNIVKIYETFADNDYFYIVMEYCSGVELFDYIEHNTNLSEETAAALTKSILGSIKHLHSMKICHRDLKPENIIFDMNSQELKLVDFGLSKVINEGTYLETKVGTPFYVAPEVLRGKYNKQCDMWSVGVIAYVLLSGYPPFYGDNNKETYRKILKCEYEFNEDEFGRVSTEAIDFVRRLLVPNAEERMTAEEALAHKWITRKGII